MLAELLEQQGCNHAVEHAVTEEFESLVVRLPEAAVRQRLPQQGRVAEAVPQALLQGIEAHAGVLISSRSSAFVGKHQAGRPDERYALLVFEARSSLPGRLRVYFRSLPWSVVQCRRWRRP
jgi:hypothetical protein